MKALYVIKPTGAGSSITFVMSVPVSSSGSPTPKGRAMIRSMCELKAGTEIHKAVHVEHALKNDRDLRATIINSVL